MSKRDEFIDKLYVRLKEWNAEIDRLEQGARNAQEETRLEYERKLADLRTKQRQMERQLQQLSEASETAWDDMRKGTEAAFENFGEAVRRAMSRFS